MTVSPHQSLPVMPAFTFTRLGVANTSDSQLQSRTFKLYLVTHAATLAFCVQESKRKRDDDAFENEQCVSIRDEVIAAMKRLWLNGFVWRTVPHDVQKLEAGLVAFRALEDYHA